LIQPQRNGEVMGVIQTIKYVSPRANPTKVGDAKPPA
jgi:hypothetical protein